MYHSVSKSGHGFRSSFAPCSIKCAKGSNPAAATSGLCSKYHPASNRHEMRLVMRLWRNQNLRVPSDHLATVTPSVLRNSDIPRLIERAYSTMAKSCQSASNFTDCSRQFSNCEELFGEVGQNASDFLGDRLTPQFGDAIKLTRDTQASERRVNASLPPLSTHNTEYRRNHLE